MSPVPIPPRLFTPYHHRGLEKLTPGKIKRLKKSGKYSDGGGLYLQITPRGTKSWLFRRVRRGVEHSLGLGPLSKVGLEDAREAAREIRVKLAQGEELLQIHTKTFDQCLAGYLASHRCAWRSARYARQWERALRNHISPHLGKMSVRDIETKHLLQALTPLWATRTQTASRLRGSIERILAWAALSGYREGQNPARWRGHLQELLPHPARIRRVRHHPAMPYQEVGAFFERLAVRKQCAARALAFTLLTACRSAEVRLAQWSEIDFAQAVWTIPAKRTKSARIHRVPLTAAMLEILHGQSGRDPVWVFPGARSGKPLASEAMRGVLQQMQENVTVHGFRSSFRVWAAEKTNHPKEVPESALAHALGSAVERAYQRSDLFKRRRILMEQWAEWCLEAEKPQNHMP